EQRSEEQREPQDDAGEALVVTREQVGARESGREGLIPRRTGGDVRQEPGGRLLQPGVDRAVQRLPVESLDTAAERLEELLIPFLRKEPLGFLRGARGFSGARRVNVVDGAAIIGVQRP